MSLSHWSKFEISNEISNPQKASNADFLHVTFASLVNPIQSLPLPANFPKKEMRNVNTHSKSHKSLEVASVDGASLATTLLKLLKPSH